MELKDIKAIIDLMRKNDLSVFEMEKEGFRLKLQKGAGEQTVFSAPVLPQMLAAPVAAVPTVSPGGAVAAPAEAATRRRGDYLADGGVLSAVTRSPPFIDVGGSKRRHRRLHH